MAAVTSCQHALYYNTGGVDGWVRAAVKGITFQRVQFVVFVCLFAIPV